MDITFKQWTRKEEGNVKGLAMWWKQTTCSAAQKRSQNSNTFLESSNEGFRSQVEWLQEMCSELDNLQNQKDRNWIKGAVAYRNHFFFKPA